MPGGRPSSLVTLRDLELFYDVDKVRQVFDRQQKGQPDPAKLENALETASDIVQGMCLTGFSLDAVVQLAAQDRQVKLLCCRIVMGVGSLGQTGLRDADGKNVYQSDWDKAETKLRDIVKAKAGARLAAEETVARNANLGARIRPSPQHTFIADTTSGRGGGTVGPGGF